MKKKPYNLLLLTALILFLTSFLMLIENDSFDIHLHDSYFVISKTPVFWLLAIIAFVFWTLYALTRKILYSKNLTWVHVIITILTLLLIVVPILGDGTLIRPQPVQNYDYSRWNSLDNYSKFNITILYGLVVMLCGQILFIVNILAGLIKVLFKR